MALLSDQNTGSRLLREWQRVTFGFLIFSHVLDGPERYGASSFHHRVFVSPVTLWLLLLFRLFSSGGLGLGDLCF
jgi:hypothetical protein